ncbi:MAG: TonB-dependent receptor [Acidobacteriota bacterium]|nr:TonB-dependent receptor [Acidobacteriota bacterium]
MRFLSSIPWITSLTLALAATTLSARAVSAADLRVVVLDPDGGPAAGALVVADALAGESRVTATTGDDGRALIEGVPEGRYLVSARSADLSAAPIEVTLSEGTTDAIEMALRFTAVRESVVVSAALGARREEESGTFVDTLSADALRDRDEWFLLEGLRGMPGTLVYQTGSQGHQLALRFRGLPAQATAVVVDGAPLRDAAAPQSDATALLPSLSVLGVDRVEIRRGGGSTIYGSNGMGGVLHIVTRSESAPDALRFSAGLGEYGHSAASGEAGAGGPRGGVSAGFSRLAVSEGADGDDPFTNVTGMARAGFRPSDSVHVTARSLFSLATVGLNESPFPLGPAGPGVTRAAPVPESAIHGYEGGTPLESLDLGGGNFMPSINDPDNSQETRFLSTLFAARGSAGPDLAWTLRLHDLRTRRENEDGPAGVNPFDPPSPSTLIYEGRVRSGAARVELFRGPVRLVAGGEFEAERAATTDPGFETQLRQTSAAGFAQAEAAPADRRVLLRGALRAQRFRTASPELIPVEGSPWQDAAPPPEAGAVTGEAAASLALAPGLRLRASAGRGFRAPSLYERFGTWYSSFGYSVFGDPRLKPEYTTTMDAGLSASSEDGRHELRGAWFWSERGQIVAFGSLDFASDPFGRFAGYENTEGGVAQGVELAYRVTLPGRTRAQFRYTFTDAERPANAPEELESDWLVPRHQGGALLSGAVAERLRWSADLLLSSEIHAPLFDPDTFASRVFRFAGMRRVDVALSFELMRGLRLRALVQDALDDAAYQSGGFRPLGRVARVRLEWSR